MDNDEIWKDAKLLSRSGKATGKYKNAWRDIQSINFDRNVAFWNLVDKNNSNSVRYQYVDRNCSDDDEEQVSEIYLSHLEENIKAKMKELESWKKQQVYEEVENKGQYCISVRWVLKPKYIDGVLSTKVWLCARSFEESQDFRTDFPHVQE